MKITLPVKGTEVCPECGVFLRVCLNCQFYSHFAHHECKEPTAEPVLDKEKPNSCRFFEFKEYSKSEVNQKIKEKALREWEKLFKKD